MTTTLPTHKTPAKAGPSVVAAAHRAGAAAPCAITPSLATTMRRLLASRRKHTTPGDRQPPVVDPPVGVRRKDADAPNSSTRQAENPAPES
jgi:hypothetical protein